MLSENIRYYRKKNNMSQDELAEKLGISRQSVSLWETGQSQPTIENILALTKILNISADALLGNTDNSSAVIGDLPEEVPQRGRNKLGIILACVIALAVIAGIVFWAAFSNKNISDNSGVAGNSPASLPETPEPGVSGNGTSDPGGSASQPDHSPAPSSDPQPSRPQPEGPEPGVSDNGTSDPGGSASQPDHSPSPSSDPQPSRPQPETPEPGVSGDGTSDPGGSASQPDHSPAPSSDPQPSQPPKEFDLFTYCKDFAIEKGTLNGDYSIYQQPAARYGGYDGEYVSISYWAGSNMVEFCLHCPLDATYSINFYLRMRGGYDHRYEYLSSRYYRDSGESIRDLSGYIDPAVFSAQYPLHWDTYNGDGGIDKQNDFIEESRVGICDLIFCLKEFVEVENMACSFSDFEFVNF